MSFTEKIDVLDLLIETEREHEAKFDELLERLEKAVNRLTAPDDTNQMRRFYEDL